jgi:hypothetical protein
MDAFVEVAQIEHDEREHQRDQHDGHGSRAPYIPKAERGFKDIITDRLL